MGDVIRDRWSIPATVVSNEFIDRYMAAANGEYVKVYIYVLRHQGEQVTVEEIADFLGGTESDVRRALGYWKKLGVLQDNAGEDECAAGERGAGQGVPPEADGYGPAEPSGQETAGKSKPSYSQKQVERLSGDEDFAQLLYIAQKYLNRVFTPRDCQVFAYLYDSLGMSSELLEYLVEHCAQNGGTSTHYVETVALKWHQQGIKTAREAQDLSASYSRDSFAVMKAFGINDRRPAEAEQVFIDRWFKEYGFSREVVAEACNRTIAAIHKPSFSYTERILVEWRKAGVKRTEDVKALDAKRFVEVKEKEQARGKRLQSYAEGLAESGSARRKEGGGRKGAPNQFHNFVQRDTDYDALVLKQVKEWVGEQP